MPVMLNKVELCKNALAHFKINIHVKQKDTVYHMGLLGWAVNSKKRALE